MTYLEYYNTYKSNSENQENAFKYLVDYNLIKNFHGDSKLEYSISNKMEEHQPFPFVPSMIYTFMYAAPDMQDINGIKFIDNIPLVFVMDCSESSLMGLNFNLIPAEFRAAVLDIINDTNKNFYDKVLGVDDFSINNNIAQYFNSEKTRNLFVKFINEKLTSHISAAYRIYKLKYCKNIRLIEYDMWKYIPFLNFKKSIREANLQELQKNVIKK